MLTINTGQLNHLRATRYKSNSAQIKSELELTYDNVIQKPASDAVLPFNDWFNIQLKHCDTFNIKASKNINSFCLYAIHHYPGFPSSTTFDNCITILQNNDLAEDAKLDKVNHRLLFIR